MNIKSLSLKNILLDDNLEEYFDLSVPSFTLDNVGIKCFHVVNKDEEGRMDKIAIEYYNDTQYIDILCLMNHIFNPFSIKENDMIIIPEITSIASKVYKKPSIPTWIEGSQPKKSSTNTNEKDKNRIDRLNKSTETRKPNELSGNKQVKKYINGKIILGTNLNTKNG